MSIFSFLTIDCIAAGLEKVIGEHLCDFRRAIYNDIVYFKGWSLYRV